MIQAKAEERGVAIILSPYDTLTTVEKVEQFFGKTRFHQAEKMSRFALLLNPLLNFGQLYRRLGLQKGSNGSTPAANGNLVDRDFAHQFADLIRIAD